MKVKCIIDKYFDRELEKYVSKDEILDIQKEERAKLLINKGYVKEYPEDNKPNKESKDTKNK